MSQLNFSSQENILLIANLLFLKNTDSGQSFNFLQVVGSKSWNSSSVNPNKARIFKGSFISGG